MYLKIYFMVNNEFFVYKFFRYDERNEVLRKHYRQDYC